MKQNDYKTEFLIIGTACQRKKVIFNDINICDSNITASDKAKNRGIIFDKELNLKSHINNVCKSGYYQIRNIFTIRNILDNKSANTATHAFETYALDYGNSVLYGLPKTKLNKLQVFQNAAARVVLKVHK